MKSIPFIPRFKPFIGIVSVAAAFSPTVAWGSDAAQASAHADPFSGILLLFALVMLAAGVGRMGASYLGQAPVLGELIVGVVLGNIAVALGDPLAFLIMNLEKATSLINSSLSAGIAFDVAAASIFSPTELLEGGVGSRLLQIVSSPTSSIYFDMTRALWIFSNLGVILLLFLVGLENSVDEMMKVGRRALAVATVGVISPFLLGLLAGELLLPDQGRNVHLFLAATLCATSVGITARVFKDLGRGASAEAKIILGAAVLDDILGLIILAVVVGLVVRGEVSVLHVASITGGSVLFFVGMIAFGKFVLPRIMFFLTKIFHPRPKVLLPLSLCFFASWLASTVGLAAIVGAFAAGLILHDYHFPEVNNEENMDDLIAPIELLFAPLFFVLMGMQVNLSLFLNTTTVALGAAFCAAAILGKVLSGVVAGKGSDKLSVGIGMVPRGEVGLIFAGTGKAVGVVSEPIFAALVIMIIVTTLVTPPALKWSLNRASLRKL